MPVRRPSLDTGTLLATLRGHEAPVQAVRLTPDGTRAFTVELIQEREARWSPRVHVWDVATGRRVFTLQPPERLLRAATDPVRNNSFFSLSEPDRIEFRDGILSVKQLPPFIPRKLRPDSMLMGQYREPYTFDGNLVKP
jgi:hypothetical protein